MLHFPIIGVLYKSFNITNIPCLAIITVVVTIGLSLALMLLVDHVITPWLNKPKTKKA
ncbi:MAG TPA: hypothetical protein IAB65_05735 [Candidatus Onthocola stercorigallinarum]|jgi:peptidoglycan/LPS O-acetylase OafA/YrhL|nr:hypothetical protein [Candidatus Onthocola stercorigallinarum]